MFQTKIVDEGNKAYYDEVPRYKCPYGLNSECMSLWFKGWDQAQSDHNLFTENQTLKAKNEELEREHAGCMEENMFLVDDKSRLEIEVGALKGDNDYLREVAIRCKEDKEIFRKAAEIGYEKMDSLRSQTVEIDTLLDTSYYYSTDSTIFSFRREKIIEYLKSLRVKVLAMRKSFPEKVIKNNKDA